MSVDSSHNLPLHIQPIGIIIVPPFVDDREVVVPFAVKIVRVDDEQHRGSAVGDEIIEGNADLPVRRQVGRGIVGNGRMGAIIAVQM